jgi:hypothetical protein
MTISNQQAVVELHSFFEDIHSMGELKAGMLGAGPEDEKPLVPGLSPEGAVQYNTFKLTDIKDKDELKKWEDKIQTGVVLMERFVGVCSSAVNRLAENQFPDDPKKAEAAKYDINNWKAVTSKVTDAFFSDNYSGNQSLKTSVRGIEIAKTVIDFACSVIAGNVASFASFLKGFGDGLNAEMTKTEASYNYLYAYSTHNLFQNQSGVYFYQPSMLVYGTFFSQEQKKISTSCGSTTSIDLDFAVNANSAVFKIEQYLSDTTFKKQVDDFLTTYEAASIKKADSYFDGIFNAVPDTKKNPKAIAAVQASPDLA